MRKMRQYTKYSAIAYSRETGMPTLNTEKNASEDRVLETDFELLSSSVNY